MKRRNGLLLALLAVSIAAFLGYRAYDAYRTDTVAPEITISAEELRISVADTCGVLMQGVSAWDDKDGDVTGSVVVESIKGVTKEQQVTVTYAAFDASGNVAKKARVVTYTDYESPKFTLTEPLLYVYGSNFDVLDSIGAQDLLDGDIRHKVKATLMDETSIALEGVHNVKFRVTNSLGDTAELVLPVEVYYTGRYEAQLSLTEYLVYLEKGADFDAEAYLEEFIVLGEGTTLTGGVPAELGLRISGRVDTSAAGVYPVAYTVSFEKNGHVYEGYSKLIVVVEE